MVLRPERDADIADETDIESPDLDVRMADISESPRRFRLVAYDNCGAAIGSVVVVVDA